jgi:hypothetical protein
LSDPIRSPTRAAVRAELLVRARRALSDPEMFGLSADGARLYAIQQIDAAIEDQIAEIQVVLEVLVRGMVAELPRVEEMLAGSPSETNAEPSTTARAARQSPRAS